MTLPNKELPFLTSLGPCTVAELAAQMLRAARVDYRFDAAGSDARVNVQAGGLAWHGMLAEELKRLAGLNGLVMVVDEKDIRFVRG